MISKQRALDKGKRVGDVAVSRWIDKMCPKGCGCRLRSDTKRVWCSGVLCDYYSAAAAAAEAQKEKPRA